MRYELIILVLEAISVYLLVLWVHSLRHKAGLGPFFALIGGLTAITSWVTDAGVAVEIGGISFWVGSTIFYTAVLLGVFVTYVFDGPRATHIAILSVAAISAIMPLVAAILHVQTTMMGSAILTHVPLPTLRINVASVVTTIINLLFLAVAWEYLGKPSLRTPLPVRAYLTLLGVMWLDVLLFSTGAFLGTPSYLSIMGGTLVSRFFISIVAFPILLMYLNYQEAKEGVEIENRPLWAILSEVSTVRAELSQAQREIKLRRESEQEKQRLIEDLQTTMAEVKALRGILPVCGWCKKIRNDDGYWQQLEQYITDHSDAVVSHGMCPECREEHFPDLEQS